MSQHLTELGHRQHVRFEDRHGFVQVYLSVMDFITFLWSDEYFQELD